MTATEKHLNQKCHAPFTCDVIEPNYSQLPALVHFPFIFRLPSSVGWYIVVRPFDIGRGVFFKVIFTGTTLYVWCELSVYFTISSCPHQVSTILEWMRLFIFFLLANFDGRVGGGGWEWLDLFSIYFLMIRLIF